MKQVEVYTDGACKGNPGPGGWGAVLRYRFDGKVYEKGTERRRRQHHQQPHGADSLYRSAAPAQRSRARYGCAPTASM